MNLNLFEYNRFIWTHPRINRLDKAVGIVLGSLIVILFWGIAQINEYKEKHRG